MGFCEALKFQGKVGVGWDDHRRGSGIRNVLKSFQNVDLSASSSSFFKCRKNHLLAASSSSSSCNKRQLKSSNYIPCCRVYKIANCEMEEESMTMQQQHKGTEVPKVVLYSYHLSSCAWRVRLALMFKGIDYKYKAINILKGEQFSEEFTKLNPLQMVPAMEIDGVTLVDSIAILLYLEEKFPDKKPLLPKDLVQRAHIHQVVFLIASNIQPIQNTRVLQVIETKLGKEERLKWAQDFIARGFTALEQILEKTAGKYCFGDTVTLADVVLIPQLANANRFQVDMAPYPTIRRVEQALYELPEVKASVPANQPDAPKS